MADPRRTARARIDALLDFMFEHPETDLSVAAMARRAGVSKFHFHRLFTAVVGETLHDVAVRARLARAVSLMRADRRAPLTRIALECGFSESATFSRAFRNAFGVAPRDWRRDAPLSGSKNRKVGRPAAHFMARRVGRTGTARRCPWCPSRRRGWPTSGW